MSYKNMHMAYGSAAQTVSNIKQVVMLYDGMIRFVKQAEQAILENRIEDRFNLLNKVHNIIIGLESSLDFENGGEIAKLLDNFYHALDMRVLMIQRGEKPELCGQIVKELKIMREAWNKISTGDKKEESAASPLPTEVAQGNLQIFVSA